MLAHCRRLGRLSLRSQAPQTAANAPDQWASGLYARRTPTAPLSRSASTQRELSTYLLTRAKILQLVTRALLAYPELASLENAASPLSRRFAPGCSTRERMFMFICSLVPPDEPVDIPEFLSGATHAVHAVYQQLYASRLAQSGGHSEALSSMATEQCLALWRTKLDEQKAMLGLPSDAALTLTGLDVRDARLAEVEYSYSNAHPGQHAETQSVFQQNEALRPTVRFSVTEYVRTGSGADGEEDDTGADFVFDTTFDWNFYSSVSRSSLVDWHIADATPFVTKLTSSGDDGEEDSESSKLES